MMVGDSMRSDVVPVIEAGGCGVFVPHGPAWDLEKADPPAQAPRFHELGTLAELPELVHGIG